MPPFHDGPPVLNIAFLGAERSWYFRDLRRAAGQRHRIEPAPFSHIEAQVTGQASGMKSSGADLASADCVLVRSMPPGSLEQVVFRMDALAALEAAGTLVINPPKAVETAVDKYLTTCRLARAGLEVPRTIVCQTTDAAIEAFAVLGGDVVMKPIFGGEGRGITRLDDEALAQRAFRLIESLGGVIYLQEFIEHEGFDIRVLFIGDRSLAMRRRSELDWRTNVSRGAKAEAYAPTHGELELARRAADAVGAPLAGVDLLPTRDGRLLALEVNAVPGWRALATATGEDVSRLVLDWLERQA